jgi:hypothetical protein
MLRVSRLFVRSLAVPFAAFAFAATASTSAFAWPHLHHRAVAQPDTRVTVRLYNSNASAREVRINDRVYTMWPRQVLSIKAPVGTNVYAENAGRLHKKGEILFPIALQLKDKTLSMNAIN